jgi:hypothetical protein
VIGGLLAVLLSARGIRLDGTRTQAVPSNDRKSHSS